ncbi:DUF2157 domain-containing protein [Psychrobacter sp. F1192]|uniref:DUF2157 domain-containing protein n=1 Tax=Psychrobacter coccoides TaxID=2818440 RepID=A0ABS3NSH9_9GAMM|nr:DUF2157 domain-containing protein [Psychrobacter coccoides]MBO1531990.1 DUF2157 domain-containing protein [Psychrobacter coccoides]
MSHSRRTIEQLLKQGALPVEHTDTAAKHLGIYPNKQSWLAFFDKALLIIGAVALALALVFFIAYNWIEMGKLGKFALVEGALVINIAAYVLLAFKRKSKLIQQLLLLIASVITGSLLALFGQVYQTGADTWQLFFGWAVLITPWVMIARFPMLWLLWLGLINAALLQYISAAPFFMSATPYLLRIGALAIVNTLMFILWWRFLESDTLTDKRHLAVAHLHWSTYVVGALSTYFITHLAILYVISDINALTAIFTLLSWVGWCVLIYWRFHQRSVNVLMLTFLCFSIIVVALFWAGKFVLNDFDAGGLFTLALLLIGMSSYAVAWLRKLANLEQQPLDDKNARTSLTDQGGKS